MDNEAMSGLSMDIERVEQEKLRSLFPHCFVDGQLSVTKLMEARPEQNDWPRNKSSRTCGRKICKRIAKEQDIFNPPCHMEFTRARIALAWQMQ